MNEQKFLQYRQALSHVTSPVLAVDLDFFEQNVNWAPEVLGKIKNKTIRIATKSIRSVPILKKILSSNPVYQGLMTYSLKEALWLKSLGFKDILMGYPTVDLEALEQFAKDPSNIVLMVDLIEHLDMLESLASKNKTQFEICVDIDLSFDLPGLRFGVYRSEIHDLKSLEFFLNHLKKCTHLKLVGIMGYEAQIAGVGDKTDRKIQLLKKISLVDLKKRRQKMVECIHSKGFQLKIINGGGTGSLLSTKDEQVVTEITLGSAFYGPVLFDYYQDFSLKPSMFFGLPITRQPKPNIFTCFSGGYIASGALDRIKLPLPYLPSGMQLLTYEGAGEVQTPISYKGSERLKISDLVFFRHAKAAEICERFLEIQLIKGHRCEEKILTYRGEGKSFG
jgi:D-serine deaminase-like pyridoxal phosphate-dependent protein